MADPKTLAGKLKDEGNTFFARKDYRSAHTKYSEALKVGDQNAVLYANRAACSQHLRKPVFSMIVVLR